MCLAAWQNFGGEAPRRMGRRRVFEFKNQYLQARNQDFMLGGANEAKVDQTTKTFILFIFFNGD